ncbi:MAG: sulfur carrier protein ThiS [Bacteroides sp.]|nr:sulfur carrier protein ThiS [Bacteroides sp.]
MKIKLNSEEKEVPENTTIAGLIELISAPKGMTAFAVNGRMVKRADYASHIINEGDEVLMISAAYGG